MYSDVLRLTNSAEDLARYPGWDDSKLAFTLYHLDLVAASIEAEAAAEPDLEKILGRIRRRHAKGVTR